MCTPLTNTKINKEAGYISNNSNVQLSELRNTCAPNIGELSLPCAICMAELVWLCLFGEWLLHVGLIHQPMWLISNNETNKKISKKEHKQYDSVAEEMWQITLAS